MSIFPLQKSGANMENLPPQVIRRVTKEVMGLAEDPPEGIKVYLNEEDITDIQATIEGPGASLHGPELTGLVCNPPPSSPSFRLPYMEWGALLPGLPWLQFLITCSLNIENWSRGRPEKRLVLGLRLGV